MPLLTGPPQLVRQHFPDVHVIANMITVDLQLPITRASLLAKGEFILLLNPDTIVSEDTFSTCIRIYGYSIRMQEQ